MVVIELSQEAKESTRVLCIAHVIEKHIDVIAKTSNSSPDLGHVRE
jgi:hypothetical protein